MSWVARIAAAAGILLASIAFAHAVDPSEMLDDPALEQRARQLTAGLRCMVCQNQSIDDSDAELARDLRKIVRERVAGGDSNEEVISYVVSRYGEFVLLRPRFNARNALLWASPVILIIIGGAFVFLNARRRRAATPALSAEEDRKLRDILDGRG
ncbi:cytochrome c-type biogenesis protein [Aquamicrobium sp. LC103]|uniref:cytochrome c-type biogenesis protein n=1 Tax=Aquamicrobium sp. LC103 TaxID=1120658 RepID=UPI00063E9A49|nr:cytochrome c-type biogenesis protein [Aquamicrobium sp. LC103]TKT81245.1 cytochrome c-type biogenesis protein CcmH [Aquamicrobium sp. LC103]